MVKALALILPVASLFLFPVPLTALLAFCGALLWPPAAFFVGALADLLYAPAGLPYAAILGLVASVACVLLRGFWKARIMS